jgi:carboxyl-terminal processing protease
MQLYRIATWSLAGTLAALLLALAYTVGYVSNDGETAASGAAGDNQNRISINIDNNDVDFTTLDQIVDILNSEYFGRESLDERALYEAAIQGMLDSLSDTGTFYIDPTTNQLSIGPSGSFEGIGATVNQTGDQIVIVRPFDGSPAQRAGVESGDVILAVDGEDTTGWTVDEAVLRIRGPRGTEVVVTVRHLDGTEEELAIVRDEIQVTSVTTVPPSTTLRDSNGNEVTDLAYMRISEFIQTTPAEVEAVAAQAEQENKAGLIIDLRGNPGGLLQETVDTADLFLDEGVILVEVDNEDNENFYRARSGGAALDIPIVILQDAFSASGSEVLAAALKDNGRATIIGQKSFGKGTVNISQDLKDGGALFVTIRRWLTPAGVQIDGVGITPDVDVGPGPLEPQYDPLADAQIQRAIEHLHTLAATGAPVSSGP